MNPPASEPGRDPVDPETEAFETLVGRIGGKGGSIPAEALARHAMGVVPADEWPVRVEAGKDALGAPFEGMAAMLRASGRPQQ